MQRKYDKMIEKTPNFNEESEKEEIDENKI